MAADVSAVIVTRALAERLFPDKSPLGRTIYSYPHPMRIIGVVDQLLRPDVGTGNDNDFSTIFPLLPDGSEVTYVPRTSAQERERVLRQARDVLYQLDGNRLLRDAETFEQLRAHYAERDRTMISLLVASALGLLYVAALDITGLDNFWVQHRTRSIGIRRALGATRTDILGYFQTENFLIATAGVIVGAVLAVGLNLQLIEHYRLPRLAVLVPALRSSKVHPWWRCETFERPQTGGE